MRPAVKLVPRRDAARYSRSSRSRSRRRVHEEGDGKVEVKIMKLGSAQLVVFEDYLIRNDGLSLICLIHA